MENTTTGGGGHTIKPEQGADAGMQVRRARGPLTIQVQTIRQSRGGLVLWAGARRPVKGSPCANRVDGKRNRVDIDSRTGARILPRRMRTPAG